MGEDDARRRQPGMAGSGGGDRGQWGRGGARPRDMRGGGTVLDGGSPGWKGQGVAAQGGGAGALLYRGTCAVGEEKEEKEEEK